MFEELIRLRPSDGRLWMECCRAVITGSFGTVPPLLRAELPRALDELVKHAPKEPIAWMERAQHRARQFDFDKSAEDYAAAAALLPQTPPLSDFSSRLYLDLVFSPKVFERFTALRKDDPFPWSVRADHCSRDPGHPHFLGWEGDIKRAIAIRPSEPAFRAQLRRLLLEFGKWDRAAADHAAEINRQEPAAGDLLWVEAAAALAAAGRTEEYRALCKRMLEVWHKLEKPAQRQQLAWVAGLLPGSGADLEPMLAQSQALRKTEPPGRAEAGQLDRVRTNACTVALLHYRLGQYDRVLSVWEEYVRTHSRHFPPPAEEVVLDLLRAIALAQTGKKDDAQSQLQTDIRQRLDGALLVSGTRKRATPGHIWATTAILRREAEALLKADPPRKKETP
jgi:tetratricopeptide (TPR) repeat protein